MIKINLANIPPLPRFAKSVRTRPKRNKARTPRYAEFEQPISRVGDANVDIAYPVAADDTIICHVPTLANAKRDPVGALNDCRFALEGLEKGYHRKLYETLAVAYGAYQAFERDFVAWAKFCRDGFWEKQKRKPRRDKDHRHALKFVMIFVFRGIGKARNDRAWKYERALQLYAKALIPADQVAAKIEQDGGIEKLCERAVIELPRRPKTNYGITSADMNDIMSDVHDDDFYPEGEPPLDPAEPTSRPDVPLIFDVEVTLGQLERLLRVPKGGEAELTVRRISSGVGWKRFKAVKTNPPRRDR